MSPLAKLLADAKNPIIVGCTTRYRKEGNVLSLSILNS